jgi:hypothetical protein
MKTSYVVFTVFLLLSMLIIGCTAEVSSSVPTVSTPTTSVTSQGVATPTTPATNPGTSTPTSPTAMALPSGMGMLQVYVTDPPPPDMEKILVDVKNLQVHRTGGGWFTIDENPGSFNLRELEGIQEYLTGKIVDVGKYTQIRLEVVSVNITVDSVVHSAKVPSGEIKLVGNFEVADGSTTTITLDFNGKESVNVTGNNQYIFKPVVKLLVSEPSPSSTPTPSTEAEIITYSLPAQTGDANIDSGAGTINVEVASGTDVTNMTASFTTSTDITSIQVGTVDQVSGDTSNDFSTPVTYVVTAEDGVTTKSWVVTVTVATP